VAALLFFTNRQLAGFLLELLPLFFKKLPPFALKKRAGRSIYSNQD